MSPATKNLTDRLAMVNRMGGPSDERSSRERAFHDRAFTEDIRSSTWRYYRAVDHVFDAYRAATLDGPEERVVLEYGCGRGGVALELAANGHEVHAIDISPEATRITEERASELGVNVAASVMDAHALTFEDEAFDLVCGSGILHHLDLEVALGQIRRVLRPGGRAVFIEPLGHNPAINAFRRRTPQMRTEDERPLRRTDLSTIEAALGPTQLSFGGLLTLPAIAVRASAEGRVMDVLRGLERRWLRSRRVGSYAWFALTVSIRT